MTHVSNIENYFMEGYSRMDDPNIKPVMESSGGFVNYYLVDVKHPQRKEQVPYRAECEDIMDALDLTPDEANIFKEIWRTARQRQGNGKAGNTFYRAAQKIVHYANRILRKAERQNDPLA